MNFRFKLKILSIFAIILFSSSLTFAGDPPAWDSGFSFSTFYGVEDGNPAFSYNFSQNATDPDGGVLTFSIDTDSDKPIDSDIHGSPSISFFDWISLNSSTGILQFDSIVDNQTGRYNISIQITDDEDLATTTRVYFIINATNDFPEFVQVNESYNTTQDVNFLNYFNASDEEGNYPLLFNLTFESCNLANWSNRANCTLFDVTSFSNTSAVVNFTPTRNDVGTYYFNLSVMDAGENYSCPYNHCEADYSENKTTYFSSLIQFDVYATLQVNATDCQNSVFQENETGSCIIVIDSRGSDDTLNISSLASLRNYESPISNTSWFYGSNQVEASNFTKEINISFIPGKTEIGNWTINFTVEDLNFSESVTQEIFILVNRTYNDVPEFAEISNQNFSTGLLQTISISVYDDDLLIPDKSSLGGYNESSSFSVAIYNQSNLGQELTINDFEVTILEMPVSGTNRTSAKIELTPGSEDIGDYTIYLDVLDGDAEGNTEIFNLSIFGNNAPSWNETTLTTIVIYEGNNTYLNFSQNVSDLDSTNLVFSVINDTQFDAFINGFNLTSGVANFTPENIDVGQHIVNITVSDGFLSDTLEFNFTVYNVNDNVSIQTPLTVSNGTGNSNIGINVSEDNYTTISMNIQDEDLKVPLSQVNFFNESHSINYTFEGPNPNLFNFSLQVINRNSGIAIFQASFTPNKSDVGQYNITINVSDLSFSEDSVTFNLNVEETFHYPIITQMGNQTSSVNRTLSLDINASDIEDIDESYNNMTFSYNFLNGTDFINSDETIFNSTSGVLNITFNSTQAGVYRINVTVNDSTNLQDSTAFWIYVYDTPRLVSPSTESIFNLQENVTGNLSFVVNDSVGDNLTYEFYLDDTIRLSKNDYGNGSNVSWSLTPNYTDETYGAYRNITLVVLNPLFNDLNFSQNFGVNISHSNAPVEFSGSIGDRQADYAQTIEINLSTYFSDVDYSDVNYNQSLNFTAISNESSSSISVSLDGFIISFSAGAVARETFNITARDINETDNSTLTSALSNNFEISFTEPSIVTTPSSGGGSSVLPSFTFIMPEPMRVETGNSVNVSFGVFNDGRRTINGISLNGTFYTGGLVMNDFFVYSIDPEEIVSLGSGETKNITAFVRIGATIPGYYTLRIVGESQSPRITEKGDIIFIIEDNKLLDRLLFTEQRIAENPECLELKETLDQVKILLDSGNFVSAEALLANTLRACDENIGQRALFSPPRFSLDENDKAFFYLALFSGISLGLGILYYVYKEIAIRRAIRNYLRKL